MAKYVYPAIFSKEDCGYSVRFPDVSGCYTQGDTLEDALEQAKDALCLMLCDAEEHQEDIALPSALNDIFTENGEFVSLVSCDTLEYRKFFDKKAVKKCITDKK